MTHFRSIDELPPNLREQVRAQMDGRPAPISHGEQPKRPKYGNRIVTVDGKRFDSQLEADYYRHLCLLWHAGEIRWFIRQAKFELPGGIGYVADFLIVYRRTGDTSQVEVEDTKGVLTADGRNKLKLMEAEHHIVVRLVQRAEGRGWRVQPWR